MANYSKFVTISKMKRIRCAICREKEELQILYKQNFSESSIDAQTFSARRIPDRIHYQFVRCNRCGLIFSNPILSQAKINSLYSKSGFNYGCESEYLKHTYFEYFKKYLLKNDYKRSKILEVGCGNGFFLEELWDNGIKNIYGVEPGKPSVQKASLPIRKRIKIDILRRGLYDKESFDIICCFHTLDHIPDPNKFLEVVYSLLKKNGKVFFIVHNTDGLPAKILGSSFPIYDIEHIYLFNKHNLSSLFSKNKFRQPVVFEIANKYPLRYWLKLFPMSSSFKIKLLNLLGVFKLESVPLKIQAGNIGIVAKK